MMTCRFRTFAVLVVVAASVGAGTVSGEERFENFDRDPKWNGHNNRATVPEPQEIRQDFGYSRTRHAGGETDGEIGGFLTPAAEPAYYAKPISKATFNERLRASGKLACTGRHFHVLVGFFNSKSVNEWRTPNSIFLRIYGRGDVFYGYVEYCTTRWRAGGDYPQGFVGGRDSATGRTSQYEFPGQGKVLSWSLDYDPDANGGKGAVNATIGDVKAVCHLDDGHKQDGAVFDRFGLLSIPKSFDTGGEFWLDEVNVNGSASNFDADPKWEEVGNRRTYISNGVRPRFDFGFSPTHFAGGAAAGEIGGEVFRGDIRYPERVAYYGDRVESLRLDKPIKASGRICLRRGVSDSTTLIGFFHSKKSVAVADDQRSGFPASFLGVSIEGPSREGFQVYPAYRFTTEASGNGYSQSPPHILPDGSSSNWSFEYDPAAAGGNGRMTVTLGDKSVQLTLPEGDRKAPDRFDRFGIVTTWVDGNAQRIYFDDLRYTIRH